MFELINMFKGGSGGMLRIYDKDKFKLYKSNCTVYMPGQTLQQIV